MPCFLTTVFPAKDLLHEGCQTLLERLWGWTHQLPIHKGTAPQGGSISQGHMAIGHSISIRQACRVHKVTNESLETDSKANYREGVKIGGAWEMQGSKLAVKERNIKYFKRRKIQESSRKMHQGCCQMITLSEKINRKAQNTEQCQCDDNNCLQLCPCGRDWQGSSEEAF